MDNVIVILRYYHELTTFEYIQNILNLINDKLNEINIDEFKNDTFKTYKNMLEYNVINRLINLKKLISIKKLTNICDLSTYFIMLHDITDNLHELAIEYFDHMYVSKFYSCD